MTLSHQEKTNPLGIFRLRKQGNAEDGLERFPAKVEKIETVVMLEETNFLFPKAA